MAKQLRRRRRISVPSDKPQKSPTTITVEQSHAKQIRDLPQEQREVLMNAIREGTKPSAIAAYFAGEGWLKVQERTFIQYIAAFKRLYPSEIIQNDAETINGLVNPSQPELDEELQLEQLIRLQKRRLRIGMDFEDRTRILTAGMQKEIKTAGELIESLAKVRGKLVGAGRPTAESQHNIITADAKDALQAVSTAEAAQSRLTNLTGSLAKLLEQRRELEENDEA